jgi:hypothetical protein
MRSPRLDSLRVFTVALFLALGVAGLVPTVDSRAIAQFRQFYMGNSEAMLGKYYCAKDAAGPVAEMGFLATNNGEPIGSDPALLMDYFTAQYVVAPTLLANGYSGQTLAIAHYTEYSVLSSILGELDLEVVHGCGDGIYVLHRREP